MKWSTGTYFGLSKLNQNKPMLIHCCSLANRLQPLVSRICVVMYETETLIDTIPQKRGFTKKHSSCAHMVRRETPFKIEHGPGRDVRVDMSTSLAGVGKLFS